MRNVLLLAFFSMPICLGAQTAALPVFIGQSNNLLPPTVDASGQNVVFGSPIAPDGTNFGVTDLYAIAAAGSGVRRLTSLSSPQYQPQGANGISLTSDAANAAFTVVGPSASLPSPPPVNGPVGEVHVVNVATGLEHVVAVDTQPCLLPLAICFGCTITCIYNPHITADGAKVLYSARRSQPFYTVNADGTGLTNLPIYSGAMAPSAQRVVSRNGLVTFTSSATSAPNQNATGAATDVYTMNLNGSNLQNLTNLPANSSLFPANATISADGKSIAFEGIGDSATAVTNTNPGLTVNPNVVPVLSSLPVTQIWMVKADGSSLQALTSGPDAASQPSISGDGSLVAFVKDSQIYLVHSDGTGLKALTNFQLSAAHDPVISEDGSLVVFDIGPPSYGIGALYAVKTDGTNLHPVYAPRSLNQNGVTGMAYGNAPSPGSLFSAYGLNLAPDSISSALNFPLPTTLGGLSLLANGIPAPLIAVSPWQVNAQLSPEQSQGPVAFQLRFTDGASPPAVAADVQSIAPAIFILPSTGNVAPGQAAAFHANSAIPADQAHPATAGEVLEIYGTGLGSTDPPVAAGAAAPSAPPAQTLVTPQVLIGNVAAQVLFSGLTPGLAGVYQVNAVVPKGLKTGFQSIVWKIDNNTISNSGGITVQ